ncbi:MAG: PCRF domain-containing protein, partial [Chloroflexota bacterium]
MLLDNLAAVEARFNELNKLIEENIDDYQKVADLSKEKADIEEIVEKTRLYRQTLRSIDEAQSLQETDDADMRGLAQEDLERL